MKHQPTKSLFFICALMFLPSCNNKKYVAIQYIPASYTPHTQQPIITIWIHGTRFVYNILGSPTFNDISQIKPLADFDPNEFLGKIGASLCSFYPSNDIESVYIFGWSGNLNAHVRQAAALVLYHELHRIITHYEYTHQIRPRIRIVTHSHGGNVVLNLAKIPGNITIDELIMLACPVQTNTMEYVNCGKFRKVYAFFSSLDIVQIIAPQLIYQKKAYRSGILLDRSKFPPISSRHFPHYAHVHNVKIKLNGRAIFHSEFASPRFLHLLPAIIDTIDGWKYDAHQKPYRVLSVYTGKTRYRGICNYAHTANKVM